LITHISCHYTHLTSFLHKPELRWERTIKQLGQPEITLALTHSLIYALKKSTTWYKTGNKGKGMQDKKYYKNWKKIKKKIKKKNKKHMHARTYTLQQQFLEN